MTLKRVGLVTLLGLKLKRFLLTGNPSTILDRNEWISRKKIFANDGPNNNQNLFSLYLMLVQNQVLFVHFGANIQLV
jgi:hypothetical protein